MGLRRFPEVLTVTGVFDDGPAWRGGVRVGDRIYAVDRLTLPAGAGLSELSRAMDGLRLRVPATDKDKGSEDKRSKPGQVSAGSILLSQAHRLSAPDGMHDFAKVKVIYWHINLLGSLCSELVRISCCLAAAKGK